MHLYYPQVVMAVRTLTALVFLTAALSKLRNLTVFGGVVANYRILPEWLSMPFARLLPLAELLLSVALLLSLIGAEYVAAGLLFMFAFAMGLNILRGRAHIDCGCFSSVLKQPLRWGLVMRNVLIAVMLLAIAGASGPQWDSAAALGLLGGVALFLIVQSFNAILAMPARIRRAGHA
jgi:Methylamine utilisation protein MauE